MCKATTPSIKQSCASQWRACASRCLGPSFDISLRLCLNLWLILPENNLIYVYGDWWFQLNHFDSNESLFLHQLATHFYVPDDVPPTLQPFTTGCVKLQLPSLRRDAWSKLEASRWSSLIWWWFSTYFDANTFDTKLFSHVIIGIDHSWSEVRATTHS